MNGRRIILMKTHKPIDARQPDWVCRDCGKKWGLWWDSNNYSGPVQHSATYHNGKCGVCQEMKDVTEARDYGYLKENWYKLLVE